jgi:hypothetical protein
MRPLLPLLLLLGGCASAYRKPCEFPLWVRVTANADEECREKGAKWADNGRIIPPSARIRGCSPKDQIITNGDEANLGHELRHHVDRNCLN